MKIKIINNEKLTHWNIFKGDIFTVQREEKQGPPENHGYWVFNPKKGEVKILKDECKVID